MKIVFSTFPSKWWDWKAGKRIEEKYTKWIKTNFKKWNIFTISFLQEWRKWNTRLDNGTKNVSFVAHVTIQLAQNPSSPKNMTFIVPSVMKTSLPPSVSSVTRWLQNEKLKVFQSWMISKNSPIAKWQVKNAPILDDY